MKKSYFYIGFLIVVLGILNLGTIRKKDDPILKTQTDPILYQQKVEETKDGEKGPPLPSYQLYHRSQFLTESPVGSQSDEEMLKAGDQIPELGAPIPENLTDEPATSGNSSDEGWWVGGSDQNEFKKDSGKDETVSKG